MIYNTHVYVHTHKYTYRDESDLAALLITFGCNVNLQSDTGRTPLHRCAWHVYTYTIYIYIYIYK